MKNKLLNFVANPNLWVGVFSVLAVVGIICLIVGYGRVGMWLLAPLLVGGVFAVSVLIPVLIRANRKHHERAKGINPKDNE